MVGEASLNNDAAAKSVGEHTEKDVVSSTEPERRGITVDDKWLEAFYKECGREVTLAYTTLNQMKNWAMLIAAAAISGLSFGTSAQSYPNVPLFTGVVVVYAFVLRFFIRAILCYINLARWNRLQADCVSLKLIQRPSKAGADGEAHQSAETHLREDVRNYYYEWLSPMDRKTQVLSNLKLGFALLFALPLFFMVWGVFSLWTHPIVRGLAFFAIGDTAVEVNDFVKSKFFDDVAAYARRRARGMLYDIFPVPASRGWFLASWIIVLCISVSIATWPKISWCLKALWCCVRS
jgi:hypothetical protein